MDLMLLMHTTNMPALHACRVIRNVCVMACQEPAPTAPDANAALADSEGSVLSPALKVNSHQAAQHIWP